MVVRTQAVDPERRLVQPQLTVLGGARAGESVPLLPAQELRLGSGADCALCLPELQPLHARLRLALEGTSVELSDHSEGKTWLNGVSVHTALLRPGDSLRLGPVELRLIDAEHPVSALPSPHDHFGPALGRSLAMREIFGLLEAVASTKSSVLLLGETGSGKDVLARAVHAASSRGERPMQVLDCGALAPSVVESELFGHARGAFTGAEEARVGAFEQASGSTLFLDEVGELPLDVQPKLLRALDEREISPVGSSERRAVDVRLLAATKRDLAEEVRRGRFREDLYFRLAVLPVRLPPLRERKEDIPQLVARFIKDFSAAHGRPTPPLAEAEVQALLSHDWPGNVRELKNTVERALWLTPPGGALSFYLPQLAPAGAAEAPEFSTDRSYAEHMERWEAEFEAAYLPWLMARSDGVVSKAARTARTDRKHLSALLKRHGLRS